MTSPLLRDLLELAAENGGRRELQLIPRLESEVDHLHRLLLDQRAGEGARLRAQKLTALGEFAAGAGHEINNPLAVISGQAQYLLGQEADPDRQKSLRTVIQQSQRIHQILTDLMQFSRPARPQKQAVDVRDLAHDAAGALSELAITRQIRTEVLVPDEPCVTDARLEANANGAQLFVAKRRRGGPGLELGASTRRRSRRPIAFAW